MSKLNRLAAMDAREIVYRVQEKVRSETERFRHRVGVDAASTDSVFDDFKNYLKDKAAPHFYLDSMSSEGKRRRDHIRNTFPNCIGEAVEDANRICQHRVRLLGFGEVDLGPVIDWHRDPLTGKSWSRRFWADYDLVHDSEAGDPKVIHELNRHQQIVILAKAYFLTGDERYSQQAVAQMDSWIDQNPPSVGINWQSSLEISIRAISWIWSIFLLLPSPSLSEAAASRIGRSLFAQIDHVGRFPSLFSSPNTHLIGEATALFVAGTVFQGVEHAARWQRRGADWLIRTMERQVTVDGVHGELSSYYHCYTVDFFLQALTLSKRNGFEFPRWMSQRLDQMLEFVSQVSRNDGTLPLIGDDDGGRALPIVARDYRSSKFGEEMVWLLGQHMPSAPPLEANTFYPVAGYAIQRSGWSPRDSQVIFDCGGLGMLNGGHGHADALSIVLSIGETEILTDPGTFVYNGDPEWRDFFRSTRAHNIVVVDDCDQSVPEETFKWRTKAQCRVVQQFSRADADYVEAEHNGYLGQPCNILHRRSLLHVRPDLWVVVDELLGQSDEHKFDFYFHFPPKTKLSVRQESSSVVRVNTVVDSAKVEILMCMSATVKGRTIEGQTDPIQGWVSSLYGEKSPAPALCMEMRCLAPASGMFIILPSHSGEAPHREVVTRPVAVRGGSALACEAEHDGVRDIFMSSVRDQRISILDFTLRGRFFWIRQTNGRLTHVLGMDCKEVRQREQILMSDEAGQPRFEYLPS